MRVVMTGRGTGGSWSIRGEQLGVSIGAEVSPGQWPAEHADVTVLVKRAPNSTPASRAGALVWDVVDAYPQPLSDRWIYDECKAWLQDQVRTIRPDGIVAATQAMAEDCSGFGIPVLWLPHHARPGIRSNPVRSEVRTVGYEGAERYLGWWRSAIERECANRGWQFVVNPEELASLDIVLALRAEAAYAPRNWKSNIKLANAQGSGTPVVCCREAGYLETQSGLERWADSAGELKKAFESLESQTARAAAAIGLKAAAPSLDAISKQYLQWLQSKF